MNLFDLHVDKSKLKHAKYEDSVPELLWKKLGGQYIIKSNHEHYKETVKNLRAHEHVWAKDSITALDYAVLVLDGAFKQGENVIKQDPMASMIYATQVLNHRWPPGEPAISKNPLASFRYSAFLKDRFELGEPAIMKDPALWGKYQRRFGIKKPQ